MIEVVAPEQSTAAVVSDPGAAAGEHLRRAVDDLADQLCAAVDGDFDFMVRSSVEDEVLEKLAMLVNFLLDSARRGMSALRERNAALAQLDQAKSVFFSNTSHELRTPLTLILGPLHDAIAAGEVLQGEPLAAAHRNAARLLKLVNALLDFSRIEAGRLQAIRAPVDLGWLTADVASLFRNVIEGAGLRLEVDCQPLPRAVSVDPDMWERMVANLLSNAFKFTFEGGIQLRLRQQGDTVVLEVTDSGIGIPAVQIPHLFERFHRIEGARSRTHEGSGIGLAMVHELAKLHGGSVEVSSREGTGSTFRLVLPLVAAAADKAERSAGVALATRSALSFIGEMRAWGPAPVGPLQAEAGRRAAEQGTVLVVDDNADMRAYLARVLGPCWNVRLCNDGLEALAAVRSEPPDLVLCDVMMPNLDGLGLLRALRADAATCALPVILLSARADPASVEGGLELSPDDYLVKPFSARELVARVRSRLELARMRALLLERERAARAEAEAANRAKDRFIAMLGHELRNPLAPILASLYMLNRKDDPDTQRERAIIGRQLTSVKRLVDDLMDIARISRCGVKLELECLDLGDIAAKAIEACAPLLESRRHQLVVDLSPALLINADPSRLCQVVSNLLTNAAKYTDPGGRIELKGRREAGDVVLQVRDNGIGVDSETLSHIFDPFVQAEQSIDRSIGGLGLGLAIVKSLVDAHSGSIEVSSDGPGAGTLAVLRLPKAEHGAAPVSVPAPPLPLQASQRPQRILVVDDNPDAAEALANSLSRLGHQVSVAADGVSALRLAGEARPQIGLLDLELPGMDGYALARCLHGLPGPAIQLLAVSGHGEADDLARSRQAGCIAHLVKPVDMQRLVAFIEQIARSADIPAA